MVQSRPRNQKSLRRNQRRSLKKSRKKNLKRRHRTQIRMLVKKLNLSHNNHKIKMELLHLKKKRNLRKMAKIQNQMMVNRKIRNLMEALNLRRRKAKVMEAKNLRKRKLRAKEAPNQRKRKLMVTLTILIQNQVQIHKPKLISPKRLLIQLLNQSRKKKRKSSI